ncbi:protein MTSS 1-like isoform X3 [Electrophorus electricus]|uniref:protein MTSS 1-like isoform X3 n=1 Tax=Electrophorus electricus TaxID=8005 RepID=UPI0015D039BC|nr:protein MTSS 1-like isoform X3 [Electrophorus electricus]
MEAVIEKECSALGGLFQAIIADMKASYPVWEDFISKAGKLQCQLRTTAVAVATFLDAFQKVADLATSTKGGTRDIGSALTRMCMRHRSIEAKLRHFSMAFVDCLISPLQEQLEDWKRGANTLDKDHAKEYKKARQEIKKKSSDTLKLQKKAKKADALGRGDIQPQLDSAVQDVNDKYLLLEETEKQAVRRVLVEERARFCGFVSMLRPVVDEEMSMLSEIIHLQTIADDLKTLTMDPHKLPPASEQVIHDVKGSDYSWSYQTPPSSPSTTMSRKSSMCSSLNSVNSSDSRSSGSHPHSPSTHYRYRSPALTQPPPGRLASVSSHDSGFVSHDAFQSKSPSPLPPDPAPQHTASSSGSSDASETCQSASECSSPASLGSVGAAAASSEKLSNGFDRYVLGEPAYPFLPPSSSISSSSSSSSSTLRSWSRPGSVLLPDYPLYCALGSGVLPPSSKVPSWKDWAKPGPYDQPMVNTLRKRKEPREVSDHCGPGPYYQLPQAASFPEDGPKTRSALVTPKVMMEEMEAREELALALSRGLQLDTQRSSRDSLHCSSGYSTQTTTPCCSEDTIPSQVSDYDYFSVTGDHEVDQQDFDKSSTIPRNSDISQSYRKLFQAKRPASTAGLPSTPGPVIVTPGVATIRRTPSTKPSVRRAMPGIGPIPIKTPVIPVMTPTVPDVTGGIRTPGEEGEQPASPGSPTLDEDSEQEAALPVASWSGQASTNPPLPLGQQVLGLEALDGELEEDEDELDLAEPQGDTMLLAIRRGVKLKKTMTNDRSAPRFV